MIKNVLPSLRQRAGPQRIYSREKSIRSGTARDSFSQTPHMRGKVCHVTSCGDFPRITPACAGKSFIVLSEGMIFRDYPRVCGEKRRHTDGVGVAKGSPPHVRGKAGSRKQGKRAAGITPACAGKSPEESGGRPGQRDHPRMCGEKRETALSFNFVQGSPPHMRGKEAGRV